jgi:hypothetical protein
MGRHPTALIVTIVLASWLAMSTILALLAGWFRLAAAYPNTTVEPILRVRGQSGTMGPGVTMAGILTLSVCPSGLRVGILRVFAPFCRDFFVPWEHVSVTRTTALFLRVARLQFGRPPVGTLVLAPHVANRLARAAAGRWPEVTIPSTTRSDLLRRLVTEWFVGTSLGALFFTLAPLAAPRNARPPIAVAILFPAIVMGLSTFVRFLRERD